jgi:hypothetical protein
MLAKKSSVRQKRRFPGFFSDLTRYFWEVKLLKGLKIRFQLFSLLSEFFVQHYYDVNIALQTYIPSKQTYFPSNQIYIISTKNNWKKSNEALAGFYAVGNFRL